MTADVDLHIAGGDVLQGDSFAQADITIVGNRIRTIGPTATPSAARRTIDAGGLLVTPGLIDLHTHVYTGGMPSALESDLAGVRAGVTTVVDAGSAGPATFTGLKQMIDRGPQTRIIPFLNVARAGLSFQPEIRDENDVDFDAVEAILARHADLVGGLKLRAIGGAARAFGPRLVEMTKETAQRARLPVMIHIGETQDRDTPTLTLDVLRILDAGDIVTHAFTPHQGGLWTDDVLPAALSARARGVVFDVGHGVRNFGFDVAERLLEAGLTPDTISTDMAARPWRGPAFSLVETMSKWLTLGCSLVEVVHAASKRPAEVLRRPELGEIAEGGVADLSLLEVRRGRWRLTDSVGDTRLVEAMIIPRLCVRAGEVIPVDWGPRPTGWLPPMEGES